MSTWHLIGLLGTIAVAAGLGAPAELSLDDLEEIGRCEIDLVLDADWRTTTDPLLDRLDRRTAR